MSFLEKAWYKKAGWLWLLWPVSILFRLLAKCRRILHQSLANKAAVPVIVVGNIAVGGTGKTPLIISLVEALREKGYQPGVVSRGYGGRAEAYPLTVDSSSDVSDCGDEAFLIASKTGCPVVVSPDRPQALARLLTDFDVDVVLSDDGLQHYKLHRDIEIVVVDGQRLFSNGLCLPAGPLREPISRLREVDYTVINGGETASRSDHAELATAIEMNLLPQSFVNLLTGEQRPFAGAPFNLGSRLQAFAGIGNPQRFFDLLGELAYAIEPLSFPDHHRYIEEDFSPERIDSHQPVVMTEKDAVKCTEFATANFWALSVAVQLPADFIDRLCERLAKL